MRRFVLLCLLCLLALVPLRVSAQPAAEPVVEVRLDRAEVMPGQYATLRITVLVPTWMPRPVEFPAMDVPNLLIRLPDRATSPVSQQVNGATWSGVSRRYLVTPLVPGRFTLPGGTLRVSYADPAHPSDVLTAQVPLSPMEVRGAVPPEAEGLAPFIAARDLTLSQNLPKATEGLKPGDSLKRTVTATIEGASPIVLPTLLHKPLGDGFAVYADEPLIEERDDRGRVSGTRKETMTLMAEGGSAQWPAVEIRWYNIRSKTIETASLPPIALSSSGGPAVPRTWPFWLLAMAVSVAVAFAMWRGSALLRQRLAARRRIFQASKAGAYEALLKAVRQRDYPQTTALFLSWRDRHPATPSAETAAIDAALRALGARRYGKVADGQEEGDWQRLEQAVRDRRSAPVKARPAMSLPNLNP